MKIAFWGGVISVLMLVGTLGAMVWSNLSNPSSVVMGSSGLKSILTIERESVSKTFNTRIQD